MMTSLAQRTCESFPVPPRDEGWDEESAFMPPPHRPVWAVSLIDRETGEPHRVGGRTLVVLSKDRELAVDHLMEGRASDIWTAKAVRVPRPTADA